MGLIESLTTENRQRLEAIATEKRTILSRSQTQFQRGETLICDRQFTLKQPKKPP